MASSSISFPFFLSSLLFFDSFDCSWHAVTSFGRKKWSNLVSERAYTGTFIFMFYTCCFLIWFKIMITEITVFFCLTIDMILDEALSQALYYIGLGLRPRPIPIAVTNKGWSSSFTPWAISTQTTLVPWLLWIVHKIVKPTIHLLFENS